MTRARALLRRMADAWTVLLSAGRAADAARASRVPATDDLRRLGISAVAFGAIRHA